MAIQHSVPNLELFFGAASLMEGRLRGHFGHWRDLGRGAEIIRIDPVEGHPHSLEMQAFREAYFNSIRT